jgi:hypothetical protein
VDLPSCIAEQEQSPGHDEFDIIGVSGDRQCGRHDEKSEHAPRILPSGNVGRRLSLGTQFSVLSGRKSWI